MIHTHRFWTVVSLLACIACFPPDKLAELKHIRPAVRIQASGATVSVVVNYDEDASEGCARLHTDFAGTANGASLTADDLGGHSNAGCTPPSISGVVPVDLSSNVIVVSDSSKRIELEVRDPLEPTISLGRCIGAEQCEVTGPSGTATLPGTN